MAPGAPVDAAGGALAGVEELLIPGCGAALLTLLALLALLTLLALLALLASLALLAFLAFLALLTLLALLAPRLWGVPASSRRAVRAAGEW